MTIDISGLSATELDELIHKAAKLRSTMTPEMPGERPETAQAIFHPAWYVTPVAEGVLLQIGHPGFGWLAFVLSPENRALLLSLLLQQALLITPTTAPTGTTLSKGGSDTRH